MNRKSPTEVSAATAGGLPLCLFFEQKDPFVYVSNDEVFAAWCGERQLPVECRAILKAVTAAFQLLVYLRIVEGKFGHEVARIVREYLLVVSDRAPEFQFSMLLGKVEDVMRGEGRFGGWLRGDPIARSAATAALVTIPESPYFCSVEKNTSTAHEPGPPPEEVIGALTDLVLQAICDANRVFAPIVSALTLEPESIQGLRGNNDSGGSACTIREGIQWSRSPGRFERYLQIRYNNPLFAPARRRVESPELLTARRRDSEERDGFQAKVKAYLDELISVFHPAEPASYAQCNDYRVRLEALIQRASELGPSVGQDRTALWGLWGNMTRDIEKGVSQWGVDSDKALVAARAAHRLSEERLVRFGDFAVAQLVSEGGPVLQEEWVPFILSHDADTILRFMSFYGPEARAEFRSHAQVLFQRAQVEGFEIVGADGKLNVISEDHFRAHGWSAGASL
jgi:hypothetical protein